MSTFSCALITDAKLGDSSQSRYMEHWGKLFLRCASSVAYLQIHSLLTFLQILGFDRNLCLEFENADYAD